MSLDKERAENRRRLLEQFMRREIDWKTLRTVWEPEDSPEYEPRSDEDHLDFVRQGLAKLQHMDLSAPPELKPRIAGLREDLIAFGMEVEADAAKATV
jgi:hypothetical protein